MSKNTEAGKGSVVIYRTKGGKAELEVKLEKETVWLTQKQIAELFMTDRSVITKHLSNIFKSKELNENSVCAIFAHTASDGKTYQTKLYNLDVIVSVGYRVNSRRATQFRIWATNVLKSYLIKGYALNEKKLLEQGVKLKELQEAIGFINSKSAHPELKGHERELLNIVNEYSNSLTLLYKYDNKLLEIRGVKRPTFELTYEDAREFIGQVKEKLIERGEGSALFGQEISHKFEGILGAIYQTFDKKDLYPTVEEKAANLLYMVIKDHPFGDGNKRNGSLLFIYYLERNNCLRKVSGEAKIPDTTIVALALLIATSHPREKDVMIRIITNLLK
ncbi:MAG: virulence protein RhuM/Fic/DOC family protein [Candidatus Omnitrophota bacterium]|nr:virulence protein RhuM/Fic/DOC family protein [Candidatus Omnitrophota bacterium]